MPPPHRRRGGCQCRCTRPAAEERRFNQLFFSGDQGYLVVLEQFKDGEDDVVDIAEAGGFALLCVMESSRPVDCNVRSLNKQTLEQ